MRTIRLQIAATKTHCQSEDLSECCEGVRRETCTYFGKQIWHDDEYKRLPECISAEKEAGK
jgi:hypothetical protein